MNESMLKKEFKSRDVNRMRNLIQEKYGDKTITQVGYTRKQEYRKEGDIWEENGRNWTIKDGIKQTINKLDEIKRLVVLPLTCPNCKKPMKNAQHNKLMYGVHKKCFDCVVKYETELKRLGQYQQYERNIMNQGIFAYIQELENYLLDITVNGIPKETFITEAGDIEKWSGGAINVEDIIKDIKEYIEKLRGMISN